MPYFFYLIEHTSGLVLFDTGPNPLFVSENITYIGPGAAAWNVSFRTGDDAHSQLLKAKFAPDDIKLVALSHLHYDHAGGMSQFPEAQFLVQRSEWIFANNPPSSQVNNYVKSEFNLDNSTINLLDGRHDIFGDNSLVLLPTPGHTPGHQSLLITGHSSSYLLTADAAYLSDLDDDRCIPGPAFIWSEAAMHESRQILRQARDLHAARVIATHDPALGTAADAVQWTMYD